MFLLVLEKMKILITGDRNWRDYAYIKNILSLYPNDTIVVEGEARGADTLGKLAAKSLGMQVKEYPADWKLYGRAAGPIRNQQMLDDNPDIEFCHAFHPDIKNSKGTKDMVERCDRKKIPVFIWDGSYY